MSVWKENGQDPVSDGWGDDTKHCRVSEVGVVKYL